MVLALTNIPKSLFYSLETNERLFLVVQTKSKAELEVSGGQERRIKSIYPPVILLPLYKSCVPQHNTTQPLTKKKINNNNNWMLPVGRKDRSIDFKISL